MKIIFDSKEQMDQFMKIGFCPDEIGFFMTEPCCDAECRACWGRVGVVIEIADEKKPDIQTETTQTMHISEEDLDRIAEAVLKRLREPIATEVYFDDSRIGVFMEKNYGEEQ